eukprot:3356888-Amphidinium_carterae.1
MHRRTCPSLCCGPLHLRVAAGRRASKRSQDLHATARALDGCHKLTTKATANLRSWGSPKNVPSMPTFIMHAVGHAEGMFLFTCPALNEVGSNDT